MSLLSTQNHCSEQHTSLPTKQKILADRTDPCPQSKSLPKLKILAEREMELKILADSSGNNKVLAQSTNPFQKESTCPYCRLKILAQSTHPCPNRKSLLTAQILVHSQNPCQNSKSLLKERWRTFPSPESTSLLRAQILGTQILPETQNPC